MLASIVRPLRRSASSVLRTGSVQAALVNTGPRAGMCTEIPPVAPKHFRMTKDESHDPFMNHPTYTKEEMNSVRVAHRDPVGVADNLAFYAMKTLRVSFDTMTGYGKNMDEHKWLTRMIFLESVAGVPGMVGGMWRHFRSLRTMKRDFGWIHTLLEEAENERMHLMTFLELRKPGPLFRAAVLGTQGLFFNLFFISYILSPSTCHRFVGFLEEEAVVTYTKAIQMCEEGHLKQWEHLPATKLSKKYWRLEEDAKFLDVLKAIRADEMVHREVNHALADAAGDGPNPFAAHYMQQRDVTKDPSAPASV